MSGVLRLFDPAVLACKAVWRFITNMVRRLRSRLRALTKRLFPYYVPKSSKVASADKIAQEGHEVESFRMVAVGKVESIYKEKFGTPRQGNLVPDGRGRIVLDKHAVDTVWSLYALEEFSHVWVVFIFHTNTNVVSKKTPNGKVRPPQGAGAKVGVFATRSPHRPNPIGLTMAKLRRVDPKNGVVYLEGLDLCDGTPVLDIKPYCEHVDWPGPGVAVTPKWVTNPKFERVPVTFTEHALKQLKRFVDEEGICEWYEKGESELVQKAISDVISIDPRDLNRGRGAFSADGPDQDAVPVKETSFTRRELRIKEKALSRPIYARFDALDVMFKPDENERGFIVTSIDRYVDREILKTKCNEIQKQ